MSIKPNDPDFSQRYLDVLWLGRRDLQLQSAPSTL